MCDKYVMQSIQSCSRKTSFIIAPHHSMFRFLSLLCLWPLQKDGVQRALLWQWHQARDGKKSEVFLPVLWFAPFCTRITWKLFISWLQTLYLKVPAPLRARNGQCSPNEQLRDIQFSTRLRVCCPLLGVREAVGGIAVLQRRSCGTQRWQLRAATRLVGPAGEHLSCQSAWGHPCSSLRTLLHPLGWSLTWATQGVGLGLATGWEETTQEGSQKLMCTSLGWNKVPRAFTNFSLCSPAHSAVT